MCDCPLAELYAKAARERDELRRELQAVIGERDQLLRDDETEIRRRKELEDTVRSQGQLLAVQDGIIKEQKKQIRELQEEAAWNQKADRAKAVPDLELLRDSNFEE